MENISASRQRRLNPARHLAFERTSIVAAATGKKVVAFARQSNLERLSIRPDHVRRRLIDPARRRPSGLFLACSTRRANRPDSSFAAGIIATARGTELQMTRSFASLR